MVCEVVESTDISYRSRCRPVDDFFDVAGVWCAAIASEDVAEKACFRLKELTFVDVEDQICFGEGPEN
jgi:hypothetical protein